MLVKEVIAMRLTEFYMLFWIVYGNPKNHTFLQEPQSCRRDNDTCAVPKADPSGCFVTDIQIHGHHRGQLLVELAQEEQADCDDSYSSCHAG